ncbi:MAG: alpha-L-fucosidase [Ignavibacteriales bacterium]|nr:alpha-L-fucosidase [Ignavibacteriales bacterium]
MISIRLFTIILLVLFNSAYGQDYLHESKAEYNARMQWWQDARFGLFIHWGLYAIPAGEWKGKTGHGEWIRHSAQIPVEEYEKFLKQFNPVKFNADTWVRTAKEAGMKYIVITSKHHDGFCLFDSKYTDFDVMSTPFQRDILKDLAEACRKEGIKLCFYHSIMDWHHPDYLPRRNWETTRTKEGADFERFVHYVKNELKELLTNYGDVGVIWFDGNWESTWSNARGKDLYNYVRSLSPKVIINNRVGQPPPSESGIGFRDIGIVGDFGTPEQEIPAQGLPGKYWETCMTMNDHWGYNSHDDDWKPAEDLIIKLADIASKSGNFLLNVGPTSEGLFPQASIDRLHAIGQWMKVNNEAIYGTSASPFATLDWGRCTQKNIDGETRLYLHVFNWPNDGKLVLPGMFNTVVVLDIIGKPDVSEPPRISSDDDIFIDTVDVSVTSDREDVELRYTLDGNIPSSKSELVHGLIRLSGTTTLSARCFRNGKPVSGTATETLTKVSPWRSMREENTIPGVLYKYYEGDWDSLPDFNKLKPVKEGSLPNFNFSPRNQEDHFGFAYTGVIRLQEDDVYDFFTNSDDGSRLYIDDSLVVDNDGLHGMLEKRCAVALSAGLHALRVTFFEKTGDDDLKVSYRSRKMPKRELPSELLFHSARK